MADKRKSKKSEGLNIAFVSSEAAPWVKTGGLGDVAGALPLALAQAGHRVRLFLPLYKGIQRDKYKIPSAGTRLKIPVSARIVQGQALSLPVSEGLEAVFIEQDGYFGRDGVYMEPGGGDYKDNLERFTFFCRAVLETLLIAGEKVDIVHAHDWQAAAIPAYLKSAYAGYKVFAGTRSLVTIHNMGYQGRFHPSQWHTTGLPWDLFNPEAFEFYGTINLLKGGLAFADAITTVSPTYAGEIVAPEGGFGLDGFLRSRSAILSGVLNGIGAQEWNPAVDRHIKANYSADDMAGKRLCKQALVEEMGLESGEGPLLAVVSRLADGKGMEILLERIGQALDEGARFVLLGSGEKALEKKYLEMAATRPGKMAVVIGFNEGLSHRIMAGADILLVPSRYEPCGLTQMYALAYGTAPVVRATGGLNDTIHQYDPATGKGNGFKFNEYSADALLSKILEAMEIYAGIRGKWNKMIESGMREDNSWGHSAKSYIRIYHEALSAGGR